MMKKKILFMVTIAAVMLAACNSNKSKEENKQEGTELVADKPATQSETQPEAQPELQEAKAETPIETIIVGSEGKLSLMDIDETNNMLTLILKYKGNFQSISYNKVYYIDLNTSKKYELLKDDDGHYMASPIYSDGKGGSFGSGDVQTMTLRFPAPEASSTDISLTLDNLGTFTKIKIR